MPIFEYRCNQCHKEFSQLFLNSREVRKVKCRHCSSIDLKKLISSFSIHQTEESRLASFDTTKPRGDDYYEDSRNVGLWAKKRMKEMGVDLGPKMDEIVERGRTGKILEDYDK
ncbi:MAG: zinc ribbon domain-containing protein [Deltaproteobacteria bacterium]|nr:zinc ribbon domain-containing protein [Deltaproteobacteria bacterium]